MPKTFGPLHITAHRGTWITEHQDNRAVKALTGHTKDDLMPRITDPGKRPRPKQRGILPTLTIKPTTDFTRFPTARSLNTARNDPALVPSVDSAAQVRQAVGRHIDQKLLERQRKPSNQQLPLVVLVGDSHDSNAARMMLLAAMGKFEGQDATLLMELTSLEVDGMKARAHTASAQYGGDAQAALAENQRVMQALLPGGDRATGQTARCMLTTLFAAKTGIDVGHMDSVRGPAHRIGPVDMEVRELSMIEDIKRGVQSTSGPIIVNTGALHVPRLMQAFDGMFDVVAMAFVDVAYMGGKLPPEYKRRCSYLLANDEILRLRAGPTIETQPVNAAALFHQLGADIRGPMAGPIQLGSPWER